MNPSLPFPLEKKLRDILSCAAPSGGWRPTGLARDLYLDLSEPLVRQAVAWQDAQGRMNDPYARDDTPNFACFTAARFVGGLGALISAGRCLDLVDVCARSMDATCEALFCGYEGGAGAVEFYPKEIMRGYLALRDRADQRRVLRWRKQLGEYDPEKNYDAVLSHRTPENLHNFVTFALAGEVCKRRYGIADHGGFIEKYLPTQMRHFTGFGMYRDPNDPMTYDFTPRMNLSLMRFWEYDGPHAAIIDEVLRRGGLTSLLYQSSTGQAPYGGRSNQINFNEATLAVVFEYEARRHKASGDLRLAGAFKRAARLAALSVRRWLEMSPARYTKNGFAPELQHGRPAGYGFYGVYSLLIASQFGFAHLLADDSIEEQPAPAEIGGYVLHLPDAFHKVFATAHGYHLEIDTRAHPHYDATGLGRIHRAGIPTELGLSTPMVPKPGYLLSAPPAARSIALGPGWENADGQRFWLADFSDGILRVAADAHDETPGHNAEFAVEYNGDLGGVERVTERYRVDGDGVTITEAVPGAAALFVQIPLLTTDGMRHAEMTVAPNGFVVSYQDCFYRAECLFPSGVEVFLEPFTAPNRNGIYAVGCFRTRSNSITYRLGLARVSR